MWVVLLIWILLWDRLGLCLYIGIAFGWLNINVGVVQATATAALIGVTGYYAFQTWRLAVVAKQQADATVRMAEETRETRLFATQPIIAISPGGSTINSVTVKLKNVGRGPAFNIKCVVRHPAFEKPGKRIRRYVLAALEDTEETIHADPGDPEYHDSPIEAQYQDQYGTWMFSRFKDGKLETGTAGIIELDS